MSGERRGRIERNAFRAVVALAACVPVFGGLTGVVEGACAFGNDLCTELEPFFRSHMIYLSGLLLAIGLAFWWTLRAPEAHGAAYRLLSAIVFVGGIARLAGVLLGGPDGPAVRFALAMELLVTPAICLWQARIARLSAQPEAPAR